MKTHYEYIYFEKTTEEKPNKTLTWYVKNKRSNDFLGRIEWYPRWRCYCLNPTMDTVFSLDCLADIIDFIKQLKEVP